MSQNKKIDFNEALNRPDYAFLRHFEIIDEGVDKIYLDVVSVDFNKQTITYDYTYYDYDTSYDHRETLSMYDICMFEGNILESCMSDTEAIYRSLRDFGYKQLYDDLFAYF